MAYYSGPAAALLNSLTYLVRSGRVRPEFPRVPGDKPPPPSKECSSVEIACQLTNQVPVAYKAPVGILLLWHCMYDRPGDDGGIGPHLDPRF
jgi:hypothetical protein